MGGCALATTDEAEGFYRARGWQRWQGPTSASAPEGRRRTADADGGIFGWPGPTPQDLHGELVCDWRDGDVR